MTGRVRLMVSIPPRSISRPNPSRSALIKPILRSCRSAKESSNVVTATSVPPQLSSLISSGLYLRVPGLLPKAFTQTSYCSAGKLCDCIFFMYSSAVAGNGSNAMIFSGVYSISGMEQLPLLAPASTKHLFRTYVCTLCGSSIIPTSLGSSIVLCRSWTIGICGPPTAGK